MSVPSIFAPPRAAPSEPKAASINSKSTSEACDIFGNTVKSFSLFPTSDISEDYDESYFVVSREDIVFEDIESETVARFTLFCRNETANLTKTSGDTAGAQAHGAILEEDVDACFSGIREQNFRERFMEQVDATTNQFAAGHLIFKYAVSPTSRPPIIPSIDVQEEDDGDHSPSWDWDTIFKFAPPPRVLGIFSYILRPTKRTLLQKRSWKTMGLGTKSTGG